MRYSIRFPALLKCSEGLEKTALQHTRAIGDLRQVRQQLAQLSGMEAVLAGIDRELRRLEDQRKILLLMAQAAGRARRIYMETEEAVVDEADCPRWPLTDLRIGGGSLIPAVSHITGSGVVRGPLWQVTVPGTDGAPVTVEELDLIGYNAMLLGMDIVFTGKD